jgi:arginine-tRNA-protein transferase
MVDILDQGISSVYTFFDTSNTSASYGSFSILWQIQRVLELGLSYVYLGYYIQNSEKMSYKSKFQPIEGLINDRWQPIIRS